MNDKIKEFQGKYRFLSNFWYSPQIVDGIRYKTNEHFYQAHKALYDEDANRIFNAKTPGEAKRIAKRITMVPHWDQIKDIVMYRGLKAKFRNKKMRKLLLETENAILEEGNYWGDTYWGIDLRTGKGKNKLGKMLMKIRKNIENDK